MKFKVGDVIEHKQCRNEEILCKEIIKISDNERKYKVRNKYSEIKDTYYMAKNYTDNLYVLKRRKNRKVRRLN